MACRLGYRGYSCEDGTAAVSDSMQMLYTELLTLSNLAFIPAIVVACWRCYFVEAVAYLANMVFSSVSTSHDLQLGWRCWWCSLSWWSELTWWLFISRPKTLTHSLHGDEFYPFQRFLCVYVTSGADYCDRCQSVCHVASHPFSVQTWLNGSRSCCVGRLLGEFRLESQFHWQILYSLCQSSLAIC